MSLVGRVRPWPSGRPTDPDDVEVRIGPSVRGGVVRLAVAVLGSALLLVLWSSPGVDAVPVLDPACWAAVAVAAVLPRSGLSGLLVMVVGVRVLVAGPPPLPVLLVLVLLVHLVLWCAALAARASWRARVEVAVLVTELRDVAVVQVGAQVLTVVAALVAGARLDVGDVARGSAIVLATLVAAVVMARPVTGVVSRGPAPGSGSTGRS